MYRTLREQRAVHFVCDESERSCLHQFRYQKKIPLKLIYRTYLNGLGERVEGKGNVENLCYGKNVTSLKA